MINGVSAGMEIDTGTAATIISSKQYELIKVRKSCNYLQRMYLHCGRTQRQQLRVVYI